jgi:acyl-CoA synthetase (NDP forming)
MANAGAHAPAAEIRGVLVQAMAQAGVELIAGVTFDADFGPMVMCGLGGTLAELLRDTAFAPAPLNSAQAQAMLNKLKAAPLLAGWRGTPPCDRAAFADLLVRLSRLALDAGDRLAAIDLNPVMLYPEGRGYAVVDALILQKDNAA